MPDRADAGCGHSGGVAGPGFADWAPGALYLLERLGRCWVLSGSLVSGTKKRSLPEIMDGHRPLNNKDFYLGVRFAKSAGGSYPKF